jgi:hypothetical protein
MLAKQVVTANTLLLISNPIKPEQVATAAKSPLIMITFIMDAEQVTTADTLLLRPTV